MGSTVLRTAALCLLALLGFAGNSLLTRLALRPRLIDPATFTAIRITTGALALVVIAHWRRPAAALGQGSWLSAVLLLAYAAPFSFAYLELGAGLGALVLFGAVQISMIGWGLFRGERPAVREWLGLALALGGLSFLTLPGASRPDGASFLLMVASGVSWGAYSLRGRSSVDALGATAGNFLRSAPLALLVAAPLLLTGAQRVSPKGVALATASGALTSGVAYTLWYAALPGLTALRAALVQLTVPVIAAASATVLLDERPTARLIGCGAVVLGGVGFSLLSRARAST